LADAKQAVEKLEQELRKTLPEKFTSAKGKGCLSVLALTCVSVLLVVLWLLKAVKLVSVWQAYRRLTVLS